MSALSIQVPFPVFQDRDGQPLDNGYVWIGEANLNPQTNPVVAYFDAALTIPAVQPMRTLNGYISNSGTPAQVYVDGVNFSILVQDSKGSMVYNFSDGSGISANASGITYDPAGTGAVATTVQTKLRESVSVLDFGAVGNGITDDTAAIQAAYNTGKHIYWPQPTAYYLISNTVTFNSWQMSNGDGAYKTKIVMSDSTKFAFVCTPVADSSTSFNTAEAVGGGFYDLDIRARYGIRIGSPNFANTPTYNYSTAALFFAASVPTQAFNIQRCIFISDNNYNAAYTYIAASPNFNTATIPTVQDLYDRGCAVLISNIYRGLIDNCQIKFYGIGVWTFGSDLAVVSNNRTANNLRHIHVQENTSSGYQVRVVHNDMLASYRYGGLFLGGAHHRVEDNYFENTGTVTNSTINYYIVTDGQTVNITGNRFDDYGSTQTSGPLIVFGGVAGFVCDENRVADNRPSGAGTRATISVLTTRWNPSIGALDCAWGMVQMGDNDNTFPRVRLPLVAYNLDGNNPLYWSPLTPNRDQGFYDFSSGGVVSTYPYFNGVSNLVYFNPAPFSNGIILKPRQDQLGITLNYTVTIRARCLDATVPYTTGWVIKWVTSAGAVSTLYSASKTYTTNTAIESYSQAVSIPAISEGYFVVGIDATQGDLYSILIVEA